MIPGSGKPTGEGIGYPLQYSWSFLVVQLVKNLPAMPGEGQGYTLQYSDLENSMDCIVDGFAKSQTQMSNLHFHFVPRFFVSSQQRFGATDIKALGASQLSDLGQTML